jgi:hypothetical protein
MDPCEGLEESGIVSAVRRVGGARVHEEEGGEREMASANFR